MGDHPFSRDLAKFKKGFCDIAPVMQVLQDRDIWCVSESMPGLLVKHYHSDVLTEAFSAQ
jgi:hypothetical protein